MHNEMFRDAANCAAPWWRSDDELIAVIESYHEGEFEDMEETQVLAEPISIEAVKSVQGALQALEAYHKGTYEVYDEEEWLLKVYPCNNCELCQAMRAMKVAVNSIYTAVGYDPIYDVE
jgi:hypothetical protein